MAKAVVLVLSLACGQDVEGMQRDMVGEKKATLAVLMLTFRSRWMVGRELM